MKEQNLIVFACMQELYILSEKYIQPAMSERFNTMLIQIVGDIARRDYYSEEVN